MLVDRDGTIHPHTDAPALHAADGMHPAYQVIQSVAAAWAASPEQAQRQAEQIVLALAEGDLLVFAGASEGSVGVNRPSNRLMLIAATNHYGAVTIRDVVPLSAYDIRSQKALDEARADPDLRECLEKGWLVEQVEPSTEPPIGWSIPK